MGADQPGSAPESAGRFVPVALIKPALAAGLGIDGGAIFQILAVENLGLSPAVIGAAYGVGLLSVPIQLLAMRMPLHRARRNVRLFLTLAAIQSALLAWLLAIGATGGLAATALVITVTAEVAISVLFATAWQPLLSTRITSRDRQRINAGWTAVGRGVLAGLLVVFSATEVVGRSLLLAALAVVAIWAAVALGRGAEDAGAVPIRPRSPARSRRLTPAMWWILTSFTVINLGALPLWLVYLSRTMWPSANLGLVGALQTTAVVAALLGWRTTSGNLGGRAMTGVLLLFVGSAALVGVGTSAQGAGERGAVLLLTVVMTFGMIYVSLALLEMAHRLTSGNQGVVRAFTLIDIVDSSSLQLGLVIGGLLITLSTPSMPWTPYVVFVVAMSALAVVAVARTAWLVR